MNVIIKNIPNSITCLNLLSGCFACIFAFKGDYDMVALCVGLSALFDFLDGMAARLLHAYSPLGKELDSLADLISFGLAPGLMIWHLMNNGCTFHGLDEYRSWWALSALLIPVFSALRLAKFNIDTRQTTSFIGLPVPANALFWIGICQGALQQSGEMRSGYIIVLLIAIFSFLMVSEIPMFSLKLKNMKLKENCLRYLILIAAVIFLVSFGLAGLAATIGLYIILSLLAPRKS